MNTAEQDKKPAYQVLARKYRPQTFKDVLGQDAIVTTLKNGIRQNKLAHAYLFSGSRGTGKTTLARLFAKAINCQNPTADLEPCNQCSSCKEITSGHSLDVLEIDGASNRGIDEIRQINETVAYASASGKYKVYIIDEVHMLTKEAFNALLKTLEEPPANVKFFFATTEPHKVLPTILSRCQRFQLNRLPNAVIVGKLNNIAHDLGRTVDAEVLSLIAERAEGGLRDAETLFDQMLSFQEGHLAIHDVANALGTLPKEVFYQLDAAGKQGDLAIAFEIAAQIFLEGKDLSFFLQMLTEHFRAVLLNKLVGKQHNYERGAIDPERISASAQLYSKEQLLTILDLCMEAENTIKTAASPRIALEGLLLKILRTHTKVPIDQLVKRLIELEGRLESKQNATTEPKSPLVVEPQPAAPAVQAQAKPAPAAIPQPLPKPAAVIPQAAPKPAQTAPLAPPAAAVKPKTPEPTASISEDPTPRFEELPRVKAAAPQAAPSQAATPQPAAKPLQAPSAKHDTLMQFAAVELEGKLIRK